MFILPPNLPSVISVEIQVKKNQSSSLSHGTLKQEVGAEVGADPGRVILGLGRGQGEDLRTVKGQLKGEKKGGQEAKKDL